MSIAVVSNTAFAYIGNGSTVTFTSAGGVCNCAEVHVWEQGDHITGVTYGGTAMTQLKKVLDVNNATHAIYGLLAPPTGSQTVQISKSASGAGTGVVAGAVTLSGVDLHAGFPNASNTSEATTGTTLALSVTTATYADCAVVGFFFSGSGSGGISAGSNTTFLDNGTDAQFSNYFANAYYTPLASGAAGSKTVNATESNGGHDKVWIAVSLSPQVAITATILDTVSTTETISAKRGAIATILDTVSLTETVLKVRGAVATVLDTITTSDVISSLIKWIRSSRSSSSESAITRSTSIWTDGNKDSGSFTNTTKS